MCCRHQLDSTYGNCHLKIGFACIAQCAASLALSMKGVEAFLVVRIFRLLVQRLLEELPKLAAVPFLYLDSPRSLVGQEQLGAFGLRVLLVLA